MSILQIIDDACHGVEALQVDFQAPSKRSKLKLIGKCADSTMHVGYNCA
jgi:hypothetical protein